MRDRAADPPNPLSSQTTGSFTHVLKAVTRAATELGSIAGSFAREASAKRLKPEWDV